MTTYFRVRNWDYYQHYKDRCPPWIKLHREILSSRTWVMLDDSAKALAIACMLLASMTENKVPADPAYIKRVAYLQTLPDLTPLLETEFIELVDENGAPLATASEMLANRTKRTSETETETETEKSREEYSSAGADSRKRNGVDRELETQILDAYHELLPALPAVKNWNARRHRKLSDRIRERCAAGKPADTPDYWRNLFAKVAGSDFLCGRKTDWRADLEWLVTPKNFDKVIEGHYDNNHGATNGRG
jgi:hypothetical protein